MKKRHIIALALLASAGAHADKNNASVQAYLDGAYQSINGGRATYVVGYFDGITLARAYDLPGTCIHVNSNKAVLTLVADAVTKGINYQGLVSASNVADLAIAAAFPCPKAG